MIEMGIANSSAFIALGRIGRLDLMERHFGRLFIPVAVAAELGDFPDWVTVSPVRQPDSLDLFPTRIHRGEGEVILLGLEHPGSVLLIDDWYARDFAKARGLKVIGTIGLLIRAKRDGNLQSIMPIMDRLTKNGFYLSERVISEARRLAGEI